MDSWFRNIQVHLKDIAHEVLDEATEDVVDPSAELQVVKGKLVEAEKEVRTEKENNELLLKKRTALEDQLYSKDVEIESLNDKYGAIVQNRDQQIRNLSIELDRLRTNREFSACIEAYDDGSDERLELEAENTRLKDELKRLEEEIVACKNENDKGNQGYTSQELVAINTENDTVKEAEAVSDSWTNEWSVMDMDEKVHRGILIGNGCGDNQLTKIKAASGVNSQYKAATDKRTFIDCEQQTDLYVEQVQCDSLEKDREIEKLKAVNSELLMAYNELNEEYERHKSDYGSVIVSNRELNKRIDTLRANLIEYEERYELCKVENAETVRQLEKLSMDFERLRASFEATRGITIANASDEVEKLRVELDASKTDRDRLRADVENFRSAISFIDEELHKLRESNERLAKDNTAMAESLDKFSEIREILEGSDTQLKVLRDKFIQLQAEHAEKEKQWRSQLESLSESHDDTNGDSCAKIKPEPCDDYSLSISESQAYGDSLQISIGIQTDDIDERRVDVHCAGKIADLGRLSETQECHYILDIAMQPSPSVSHQKVSSDTIISEEEDECEYLRKIKENLEKQIHVHCQRFEEISLQLKSIQDENEAKEHAIAGFQQANIDLARINDNLASDLNVANEKLSILQENAEQSSASKHDEISDLLERVESLQKQVEGTQIAKDKTISDCERLREHLVSIEDTFTKETLLAEEREIALRDRVKELESMISSSACDTATSTSALQERVVSLMQQLTDCKDEKQLLSERLDDSSLSLNENQKLLSNLQQVFQDIKVEYEEERAEFKSVESAMTSTIQNQSEQLEIAHEKEKALLEEKVKLETDFEHSRQSLLKMEEIVEELENQLSERVADVQSGGLNTEVDHEILKHMLLSYFTAQTDKKPEIALLLASIFGYGEEDLSKIQLAHGIGDNAQLKSLSDSFQKRSFAEQFVRFLENESTVVASRSLPVRESSETATMRSSSIPAVDVEKSNSEEIRSILDT